MTWSEPALRRLAWASAALMIVGASAGVLMDLASGSVSDGLAFGLLMVLFPVVGFLVIVRRPRTTLGWLMFSLGFVFALPFESYARFALTARAGGLPGGALTLALAGPTWIPFIAISGYLLLLFPDGHLPSPRWRWLAWACGLGLGILGFLILTDPVIGPDFGLPEMHNPLGIEALGSVGGPAIFLAASAPILILGGAAGMIVRLRRAANGVERHQLRWLAFAAVVVAALYGLAFLGNEQWSSWFQAIGVGSFILIPVAIGVAVLRYRLYDIDVVIKKTVVFAILAVFIAVVYVALVVGVGALVGSRGSPVLSAFAAGVVALVFQPVRARARRLADRLVYGERATPYEVLAHLSDQLAGTYAADDVLPRIARVLAEGVGAARARVWLRVDGQMREVASWPADSGDAGPDDAAVEVHHRGELLGALSVAMPANDPLDAVRETLVRDLASQAGLVLRNVRLVEELRASQRRIVAAQDQERRRIERDIHDGAQQQLVALAVKARLARQLTERDLAMTTKMLGEIEVETQAALQDLRDLARGIYPPLLADEGLAAALGAQARKAAVLVEVSTDSVGRHAPEVEAAVYFSVLEALQNVAKYSGATRAHVRL
ncbi:MAG TPA: histidine kinase, partial [Actinomycetota bacterium]|nr:histidine kinase [Actinomycetota bacterium]